ncbi:predicted protein [Sclerotinia sclerotiorum 1980 UF-70]|uniref:Uncharacterized protein n=1 Tax=Sclerotinia sclerotiorum (strain ATCC 18683 / 1980 / Ss-1) TaxID=665079 RepID=A7EH65_SCLS1|nr:predicted protein [Sclerotinia sclerotiorum 1980 UF-70]EDO02181.1 predicted protein [Sclerotinia sclerotiorum 1980 UF-70]
MIAENNSVCVVATADDVRKRQHNKPTFGLIGICKDERGRWRPGVKTVHAANFPAVWTLIDGGEGRGGRGVEGVEGVCVFKGLICCLNCCDGVCDGRRRCQSQDAEEFSWLYGFDGE